MRFGGEAGAAGVDDGVAARSGTRRRRDGAVAARRRLGGVRDRTRRWVESTSLSLPRCSVLRPPRSSSVALTSAPCLDRTNEKIVLTVC
jgi:hypothetical protein